MRPPPLPDERVELDVRLAWDESCEIRTPRAEDDRFDGEAADGTSSAVVEGASEAVTAASRALDEAADGDAFEETAARARAIEEAFGRLAEEPLSVVHAQLQRIRRAVSARLLEAGEAGSRVDEVSAFIASRQAALAALAPVDHEGMRAGRAALASSLGLYLEIGTLLKAYAASPDAAAEALLTRLEDEAARAMRLARDLYETSRP